MKDGTRSAGSAAGTAGAGAVPARILVHIRPALIVAVTLGMVFVSVPASAVSLNGPLERVSVDSAGGQGWGASGANGPHQHDRYVSGDGRYVAFESQSSLATGSHQSTDVEVFLRDRQLATTQLVSVGHGGVAANGRSQLPVISDDGRYVAFQSSASNLVAGDTNSVLDVFVRDRLTDTTERVSVSTSGTPSNCTSARPSISGDGRYVAFDSCATNWVAGQTSAVSRIFVRDRVLGTTTWANPPATGDQPNHHSSQSSISRDGRYVAFQSLAGNLVSPSTETSRQEIFVRDLQAGTTEWVSVHGAAGLGQFDRSSDPSITADGTYIAFTSTIGNMVVDDTNGQADIFVRDRTAGTTQRVNLNDSGGQAEEIGLSTCSGSSGASISGDGRLIAFTSCATNLVPGDTNMVADVFVRDRNDENTIRVSVANSGNQASTTSRTPALSRDGLLIAFVSGAGNLVSGDTNNTSDVFARQLATSSPDTTPPTITITTPADGATYHRGEDVAADYTCEDADSGIATCDGPVEDGGAVDTSSPGEHSFTVTATDNDGNEATKTHVFEVVNRPPSVDAGPDVEGVEGGAISLNGTASDADGDAMTTTWTWEAFSDVDAGATCIIADSSALETTMTCDDDGTYTATLTVGDGLAATTDDAVVSIMNAAPGVVIDADTRSRAPVGSNVTVEASFTDAGRNDSHTCTVDWGDGTTSPGALSSGRCTATRAYTDLGTYTITVTVADDDGDEGSDTVAIEVHEGPCRSLVAAQTTVAGEVCVTNDATTLTILYRTTDGWALKETHAHVADAVGGLPTTAAGNPVPGRFALQGTHAGAVTQFSYSVPLSSITTSDGRLALTTHAVVRRPGLSETAWGNGQRFTSTSWGMWFEHVLE